MCSDRVSLPRAELAGGQWWSLVLPLDGEGGWTVFGGGHAFCGAFEGGDPAEGVASLFDPISKGSVIVDDVDGVDDVEEAGI